MEILRINHDTLIPELSTWLTNCSRNNALEDKPLAMEKGLCAVVIEEGGMIIKSKGQVDTEIDPGHQTLLFEDYATYNLPYSFKDGKTEISGTIIIQRRTEGSRNRYRIGFKKDNEIMPNPDLMRLKAIINGKYLCAKLKANENFERKA